MHATNVVACKTRAYLQNPVIQPVFSEDERDDIFPEILENMNFPVDYYIVVNEKDCSLVQGFCTKDCKPIWYNFDTCYDSLNASSCPLNRIQLFIYDYQYNFQLAAQSRAIEISNILDSVVPEIPKCIATIIAEY